MARQALKDDEIEALRTTFGDLTVLETPLGTCVFRLPTHAEWVDYMAKQNKGHKHASRELAAEVVIHPDRDTFYAWCSKRVGIPSAADDKIAELAGLEQGAYAKDSDDGEQTTVTTVAGPITVKVPDERQFATYQDRLKKDPQDAFEFLIQACAVVPARAEQRALIDKYPGIAGTVTAHITRLSGVAEVERGK